MNKNCPVKKNAKTKFRSFALFSFFRASSLRKSIQCLFLPRIAFFLFRRVFSVAFSIHIGTFASLRLSFARSNWYTIRFVGQFMWWFAHRWSNVKVISHYMCRHKHWLSESTLKLVEFLHSQYLGKRMVNVILQMKMLKERKQGKLTSNRKCILKLI